MSASAVVRQATPDDLEPVAHLFDQYRQFYRRTSDLAAARAFIESRLQNGDSIIFVIQAEPAGALVGFTQLYPLFASLSIGRAFVLNDLFVSPVARGLGLGRHLLERAAEYGRDTGARYLELSTETTNAAAQRLYEKLGWVRETSFYHYSLDLG
ncbi:MAG: GNAT family N-acetyltransferase [Gemmatimonadetes bacterium]|nr:GNAT family N-acetyltransferase [Gemmatimonadota bacterium]